MTIHNHNFFDAATGKVDFVAWDAHLSGHARSFRDKDFTDAQVGLAFLTPQLYRINTERYMTRYQSWDYEALAYVNREGGLWSPGSVFYSGDIAGAAQFMNSGAFDMPYAGISSSQFLQENQLVGIGYEYDIGELNRAAMLGRALTSDKAYAAGRVAEQFCYSTFVTGKSEKNMDGLVDYTGVTAAASTNGAWATAEPDAIADDIFQVIDDVPANTANVHKATTLLMAPSKLRFAQKKRMTDGNDTVITYVKKTFRESRGVDLTIRDVQELETAGAGGTTRMVAYDNSREVVQFHLPGSHTFLPARHKSDTSYSVGGLLNIGGTEIRLPKAVSYRDNQ